MENNSYLCNDNQLKNVATMNIKEKIKEHGMTIEEVAQKLGMSRANLSMTLQRIENNNAVVLLQKIAKILGTSVSDLLDDNIIAPNILVLKLNGQSVIYYKEGGNDGQGH